MDGWHLYLAQFTQPATATTGPAGATAVAGPATTTATTQADATQQNGKGDAAQPGQSSGNYIWLLLGGCMLVYFLMMGRGPKKEEKKRQAMLDAIKRGDEVETIGGLLGKVVDVKEDRVVIKVDESANVKETYLKGAIRRVVTADDKGKEKAEEKK